MHTEYLNKCYSLLSWEESYNVEEVWAEMEKLRAEDGFVDLAISFSNELVLNLIESVNKEQMIRVIEAHLKGLAVATSKPLEFSINNHYSYLTSELGRDGKWGKVDRMSQEMYWAGCDVLLRLLVFEVEIVCVSNEIDPRKVINDLSLRMRYRNLRDVGFLESYLTGLLEFESESHSSGVAKKIAWYGDANKLELLIKGLMELGLLPYRDASEIIKNHFLLDSEMFSQSKTEWLGDKTLLSYLAEQLSRRGLITKVNQYALVEKHFTIDGKSVTKLSVSNNQASGKIRRSDEVEFLLKKIFA